MSNSMPLGLCCVCDELLYRADAGVCKTCSNAFCWNDCGEWHRGEYYCSNCAEVDDVEEDLDKDCEDNSRG